ncbi:hypothetical protein ULMS_19350 [Patiriisocius marinistellae]|uniref:Beta-lactamase-related domain-containing protein n=1 Tax=Patiriisocius marinistellae TaxID=2494560 RepID=A0A5J4FUT7_9FLAO|nr:serine hydrolase domain-containing protein [Patiriisocius marinistellae]GEQ86427.1 hypothetical protein ULMS_19350 [Patiriisocius marinistellae]
MTFKTQKLQLLAIIILLQLVSINGFSQSNNETNTLKEIIFKQDSLMFNAMFNTHDVNYVKNNITSDIEFYHDKGGKTGNNANDLIKTMERIWKKMDAGEKPWLRRELIEESFEVYPINNYGAMQVSDHKFYERQADGSELLVETAKIIHLWNEAEEGWKLEKILSYDHKPVNYFSFEINAALEQKIESWMKEYKVPAFSVGLINDGKITYSKTFGVQSNGEKATNNTVFKVASITKPVVATTVYKLVDMGLWDLDEPLHKYWIDSDIANDPRTKKLTTRLILNMQSGLPNWRHLSDSGKLAFIFNPGENVEYSGEGFEYLKKSIEAKFNRPLESIVQKMLFNKQDMDNIRFWWDDSMDESLYAGNYNANGEKYKTNKYKDALAAGNILATVDDYLKFGVHILEGADISNTSYTEMTTPQTFLFKDMVKYGYGWMSVKIESGDKILYHDGRDPGVRTIIQLYPESKQGLVIFANGDNGDKLYFELLKELSPNTKSFVDTLNEVRRIYKAEEKTKKQD